MSLASELSGRLASLALLLLLLLLGACASTAPSPADWAQLTEVLGSEEYAETFLDELEDRLDEADHDLRREQYAPLYAVLYQGAETQRALVRRLAAAPATDRATVRAQLVAAQTSIDTDAEALLDAPQVPVYRALQDEVRAALVREVTPG